MRILLINSRHKIIGGTERYYLNLAKLLRQKGHTVAFFSMHEKGELRTKWNKYFVSNVDPNQNGFGEIFKKIPRIFYSLEAKKKILNILNDFKPDVVHINNIYYHISFSILSEIKKKGIPIVQTVHDYQIISPNVIMYHEGKICEITRHNKYYKAIVHKCVDRSYVGSFIMTAILYLQNFNKSYYNNINYFITPSKFMKKKLIQNGIEKSKVIQLNNFIKNQKEQDAIPNKAKRYVLYSGRLTEAKGIYKIIDLAKMAPEINIKIAGNFDSAEEKSYILNNIFINKINNIEIVGFKNHSELTQLILSSEFVIVPSKWYENQPYAVLEAYSQGKPVIASNLGGIPEIVLIGKTGYLFNPYSKLDLLNKVRHLWNNKKLLRKMQIYSRHYSVKTFGESDHYTKLHNIYLNAILNK